MTDDAKLIQTRVPKKAHAEAFRMANEEGISVADWLRKLVLKETGVNGRGQKRRVPKPGTA